jgi:hypothetical protein
MKSRLTESDLNRIVKKIINENVGDRSGEMYSDINKLIDMEYEDVNIDETIDVLENILQGLKAKSHRGKKGMGSISREDVLKNWGLNETESRKESTWERIKRKLKGVSDNQLVYNMENGLPWDWKGSKEGYYEKMENKKHYSGSN